MQHIEADKELCMVHIGQQSRPDAIVAALLHLITAYRRSRCPALAACIVRHLEYLAAHPKAARVLTDMAAASKTEWEAAAVESPVRPVSAPKKSTLEFAWY